MLGIYHLPDQGKLAAGDDPRMARLRSAWPEWEYRSHPAGGTLLLPKGSGLTLDQCRPPVPCSDGLRWHAPLTLPTLHDLARDEIPQPSARVTLRRTGTVSLPLGVGPVYGSGRRKGQASSAFGILHNDLYNRAHDLERAWTDDDERDVAVMLFLALQSGYHLTEELYEELSPYDADEMKLMMLAIWGSDPKAWASDVRTSPPSPPASSATPG